MVTLTRLGTGSRKTSPAAFASTTRATEAWSATAVVLRTIDGPPPTTTGSR
ncbi:hypothetical protein Rai3103_00455 [Raineyella fluvialis]|uniref:Uncharacterized protein n=1 Tax=Raineyella fluvialis TaxID=2662261 RepID=A0A5Q2F6W1_9ACTN|nr:hypothetical protein Rai3103_00455 [Raineyella fluvialis]